jgi:RHS repeat-associated protein
VKRLVIALALVCLVPRVAAAQAQAETIEYYAQDAIGSIRVVFSPAGTVLARQDYGPFGRQLFTVPAMPKEGFGAQEKDDESDQSYFHARMFQARTGRFTQTDPVFNALFDPRAWNRYSYSFNAPNEYTDWDGLDPCRTPRPNCFASGTSEKANDPDPRIAALLNAPTTYDSMNRTERPTGNGGANRGAGSGRANGAAEGDSQLNQIAVQVATSAGPLSEVQTYVELAAISAAGGVAIQATSAALGAGRTTTLFTSAGQQRVESGLINGIGDLLFGRDKIGILNRSDLLRIGYSWTGQWQTGSSVFRVSLGSHRLGWKRHFDLWRR